MFPSVEADLQHHLEEMLLDNKMSILIDNFIVMRTKNFLDLLTE